MHRALFFCLAIALVNTSSGCSKSKERITPEIGNLEIAVAKTTPPSVAFTFTVAPSKAEVSQGKSECWVSDGLLAIRNMLPRIQKWHETGVLFRGGPSGFFGTVELSPSAKAKAWTFHVKKDDRHFPNNYVATSIILLDDRGNGSNQLNVWIDYSNGRLFEGGELNKLIVGKWVNELAEPDWSRKIIATFKNDGTYLFQGTSKNKKGETIITEKGTWKVADGTLETKPENPVAERTMPSGSIIFEINDMTFKSFSENSRLHYEWKRVKE